MRILVTGSAGFIAGYLVEELIKAGHSVVGIDNFSKYGKIAKSYDNSPFYEFHEGDVKDTALMKDLVKGCDTILAAAAMIGGISYFHTKAYDLLAENERILASTFDAALHEFKHGHLQKINVISSSMVYENTSSYPSREEDARLCPPPSSTYGFQKLASEYYAQGAWEQYKLPFTVIRPFNCVGIGETRALSDKDIYSGNIKLAMSHVVPDLVQKIAKDQNPLHILGSGQQIRHYTYAGDLARGIRLCIEKEAAINQAFNLSTPQSTTVLELAKTIWKRFHKNEPFAFVSDEPFPYDVQKRVPSVEKAAQLLGFKAETDLETILDEVVPWIVKQIDLGTI